MKPGIYPDISATDYFADPCPEPSLTQSLCKTLIDLSPAHAQLEHPRLAPPKAAEDEPAEKYVAAQAIGNAAHAIMLGRGKDIVEAKFDNFKSKAAQELRDAATDGQTVILSKHLVRAFEMVRVGRLQLDAAGCHDAFINGKPEVMIAWQENGLWFRALIDWLPDNGLILWDYKTSGMSCAPHAIGFMIEKAGWHIQAAMQERGLRILAPKLAGKRKYRFAAQENDAPYALVPIELDDHWLGMGEKKLEHAITTWKACMARGQWPAYPAEVFTPKYPGFREAQWLEREVEEAGRARLPGKIEPLALAAG